MSLSTKLPQAVVATVAWRRDYGLLATPDSFRLNQNPLGANRLPQALTSVGTIRHRRAFRWLGEVELSTAYTASRAISFVLAESLALM
jgi:hypothetical protein